MKKVAILGFGGMGRAAAQIIAMDDNLSLIAIADISGCAINTGGLDVKEIMAAHKDGIRIDDIPEVGVKTENPIKTVLEHQENIDAMLLCLPSVPHSFVPQAVAQIIKSNYRGLIVDILDQTPAIEGLYRMKDSIAASGILYITGGGCTPGMLTAVAALAAHSFVNVHHMQIYFGVGIADYVNRDEASLREVMSGMEHLNVEKVSAMSKQDLQQELDRLGGMIEVRGLAHGDDLLLDVSGVTDRRNVEVGGKLDTTRDKKPVSTQMEITGRTFDGCITSHRFILGDDSSMAANTAGPAVGYLRGGLKLFQKGLRGLWNACEVMPSFRIE